MKTLLIPAAALLATMLATPGFAQTSVQRDTAPIGTTEFDTSASFDRRDANRDGVLDANEYNAGEVRRYDRNRDGVVDDDERVRYTDDDATEASDVARPVQQ